LLELRRTRALLRRHAEAWEHAEARDDAAAGTAALERLGDDLKEMIEARERAEVSFRSLERTLWRARPETRPPGAPASDAPNVAAIDRLLVDIEAAVDRMLSAIGPGDDRLRAEALRIGASAREAHERLA
jgi:hypothetical protein